MANGKKLLILLLVTLVLGGGYFAVSHFLKDDPDAEAPNEAESIAVQAMETDDIVGIEYLYGKDKIKLTKDGEKWVLDADKNFPLDQAYPTTMAADAAQLCAKRLISESADDFEEYGLKEPSAAYIFTLADGSQVTYFIGNHNNYSDSYYMNVAGTTQIYLISGDFTADFDHDLTSMAEVEPLRTASTDEVTKMSMTLDGKTTTLLYAPDGLSTVYSGDFTWFFDPTTPADGVAARSLVGKAVDYESNGCAAYKATAQQLTEYGLDAPVLTLDVAYTAVTQVETGETDADDNPVKETKSEDRTLKLLVGKQAQDGSYYAKLADSDVVYLIDGSYMDALREFDLSTLRSVAVCLVRSSDIQSMDIIVDGKKSVITISRTVKEDGSETIVYKLNGAMITPTDFNTFYSSIQGMVGEGFAAKDVDAKSSIIVTYHTTVKNFETVTLQLIPYDQNFCLVDLNGQRDVLVNKFDVQRVLEAFDALQTQ